MSTVNDSFTTVAVDSTINEEKKDDEAALNKGDDHVLETAAVESDEFDPPPLWRKLLDSMNPTTCLAPATACSMVFMEDDVIQYNTIVPPMLRDMKHPGKLRTASLQKLYRFTDRERHRNRVPVVCSTRFHTLDALIPCIAVDGAAHDRRQALLILNNLCIPSENKRTILLGPSRDELFSAFLEIIRQQLPSLLLHYAPTVSLKHADEETPEEYNFSQPTEKKDSFLRVLEHTTMEFLPVYVQHRNATLNGDAKRNDALAKSVEALTLRWTFCLLRNLASEADHANLLASKTRFPGAALEVLRVVAQKTDLTQWSHDSLPEACLVFWVWLVQSSEENCRHLEKVFGDDEELSAVKIFETIAALPGIQGVRAKTVLSRLQRANENEPSKDENLRTTASF